MKLTKPLFLLATALVLSSCTKIYKKPETAVTVKDAYKENFYIGTALSQIK